MKRLHRQMVTSAAYRQRRTGRSGGVGGQRPGEQVAGADAVRRLAAEQIRDAADGRDVASSIQRSAAQAAIGRRAGAGPSI